jgi:hypothetical protein
MFKAILYCVELREGGSSRSIKRMTEQFIFQMVLTVYGKWHRAIIMPIDNYQPDN